MKDHDFLTMMRQLELHGEHRREAGAFLLGATADSANTTKVRGSRMMLRRLMHTTILRALDTTQVDPVCAVAYYRDLDPESLTGGITFHAIGYTRLSELCRRKGLSVVADIHLHPGDGTRQSSTDADHPMVARAGHLALIAPRLGTDVTTPDELGAHVMTAPGWTSYFSSDVAQVFKVRRTLRGTAMRVSTHLRTTFHMRGHR
jgi:hypothetical protein